MIKGLTGLNLRKFCNSSADAIVALSKEDDELMIDLRVEGERGEERMKMEEMEGQEGKSKKLSV